MLYFASAGFPRVFLFAVVRELSSFTQTLYSTSPPPSSSFNWFLDARPYRRSWRCPRGPEVRLEARAVPPAKPPLLSSSRRGRPKRRSACWAEALTSLKAV